MRKPCPLKKYKRRTFDYIEASEYIEKKYGIETRDFLGKCIMEGDYCIGTRENVEYQDFWLWICNTKRNLKNGYHLFLSDKDLDLVEKDFQCQILNLFLTEFGQGPDRKAHFYIWW